MIPAFTRRDASLRKSKALPAAASSSTVTSPIDLQNGPNGHFLAPCEIEVTVPDLTTTMLPDTRTATFIVQHADALDGNGDLDSPATLFEITVQTGAGGAGAAGLTEKLRLPPDVKRYIALKCTLGASTTNSSAVSMVLDMLF